MNIVEPKEAIDVQEKDFHEKADHYDPGSDSGEP